MPTTEELTNLSPEQIDEILSWFLDSTRRRQYIGARYIPILGRKGEDTIEWDDGAPYEQLTIVMHNSDTYTSRCYVPTGIDIANTNYWVRTASFNAQLEQCRQESMHAVELADAANDTADDALAEVGKIIRTNVIAFDTVSDMCALESLEAGMACRTSGFHAVGDGGGAYYSIKESDTANGMDVIALDNGLFARLVIDDHLSYSMLGAVLDGITDDSAVVRRCHDLANLFDLPVVQNHGKLLGSFQTVVVNTSLDLHGMTIVIDNDTPNELYSVRPREFIASVNKVVSIDKSTDFSFSDDDLRGKFFLMNGNNLPEWYIGTRTTSSGTNMLYYAYPVVTDDYGFKVSSPFDISYSGVITLWNVHDVNQPRITVGGCHVENHYTKSGSFPTVLHVRRSCVDIRDVSVTNEEIADLETGDPNDYDVKGLIYIDKCANINVSNITAFNNSNQALMSEAYHSYILRVGYAFNVNIEHVMATQYWGWMATLFVDTIRLSNSVVNRFDFHFGISGDCTVTNVLFRNQDSSVGIRVGCGYGNLQVSNCKFIDVYMISFRSDLADTGLGFGGTIQISNCQYEYKRNTSLAAVSAYVGVDPNGSNFEQTDPNIHIADCVFDCRNAILVVPTASIYQDSTASLMFYMSGCTSKQQATFRFRHRNVVNIRSCNFLGGAVIDFSQQDEHVFNHVISDLVIRGGRLTVNGGNSLIVVSDIIIDGSFVFDTSAFSKSISITNSQFYTSASNIASSIAAMSANTGNINWKWCYSVNAIDRSSLPGGTFDCQNIS